MLLLYILWHYRPIFMIPGSNEQLQQQLEYTLLKPDCLSWWFQKNAQKHMECFKLLFDHLAWIEHEFLSGIGDSREPESLWGMMKGVEGVRKSIHQNWLAKGLELGLLCWGFKGIQEDIPREEASTLQIGSVAFPPGQYTSLQLHPCHWLFDKDGHQDRCSPSL